MKNLLKYKGQGEKGEAELLTRVAAVCFNTLG